MKLKNKYCPYCNCNTERILEIKTIENDIVKYLDNCKGNEKKLPHTNEKITTLYQWGVWNNES